MYVSLQRFEQAVRLVSELAELTDPGDFVDTASRGLGEIVGCDVVTYNEIGLYPQAVSYRDWPPGALSPSTQSVFARLVHEHPLVNYYRETGDGRPMMISDMLDRRHFHRTALYAEFFHNIPVEHQLAVTLSTANSSTVVGLAFNRSCSEFTEAERAMLSVLRGPLIAALTKARLRYALAGPDRFATEAESELTNRERAVLALVASGRTNVAIGHALSISPRTVAKHLEHIYRKLNVSCRAAAVGRAGTVGNATELSAS
jgi:DNA-binding CsgD family transcriptional regulator